MAIRCLDRRLDKLNGPQNLCGAEEWRREMKEKNGAPTRTRTRDPLITNQVLYQLSYKGSYAAGS